jgi:four helix bundle protein
MNDNELQNRLIDFSVEIIKLGENLTNKKIAYHLAHQLSRSGTSAALNYGEARSGESLKDFLHKMKIVLKELRETDSCLKILYKAGLCRSEQQVLSLMDEFHQLISIFVKSIKTAEKRVR